MAAFSTGGQGMEGEHVSSLKNNMDFVEREIHVSLVQFSTVSIL